MGGQQKTLMGNSLLLFLYVDNLKFSHKDPKALSEMIIYFKTMYEKLLNGEVKLMETQKMSSSNKLLYYLGIDYIIFMRHYVDNI
mgnify:CR=1 FL=1